MAWRQEWNPFEGSIKTSNNFKQWRNEKQWPADLDPAQKAFMLHLKHILPNTKYGNMLSPWLYRQWKQGNIPISPHAEEGINGWVAGEREIQRLQAEGIEPDYDADLRTPQYRLNELMENRDEGREHIDQENRSYYSTGDGRQGFMLKGWPTEDSEDLEAEMPHSSVHAAIPQIIDAMKKAKRKGNELNPMQFVNPQNLHAVIEADQAAQRKNAGKVIHQFDNGWSVRQLMNADEATDEGKRMDNCVGDYGDELWDPHPTRGSTGTIIYSLRDPKNKPHVTWEYSPENWEGNQPKGPFTLNSIYGKGNSAPKPAYKAALKEFHESLPLEQRPISRNFDEEPLTSWHQIGGGEPRSDEYGRLTQPSYDWNSVVRSLWNKGPTGRTRRPNFNPEAVQRVLQADNGSLHSAVNTHVSELNKTLETLKAENNPAYEQTLTGPWAQTLKTLQEGNPSPGSGPYNLLRHYGWTEMRPHIGQNGKYCECGWGKLRPAWDPEWENHTNWEEDPFKPLDALSSHLAGVYSD
jgi:hypothetical protein